MWTDLQLDSRIVGQLNRGTLDSWIGGHCTDEQMDNWICGCTLEKTLFDAGWCIPGTTVSNRLSRSTQSTTSTKAQGTCIPFSDFVLSTFDSKFELRFQFEAAVIFPT